MSKLMTIREAVSQIENAATIALGGNVLHRSPIGAVLELISQGRKDLHVVKTAGAHDIDLLCAYDCIKTVTFGFISYEPPYGLCSHFRQAVENGRVQTRENACYTVIMGLRAAAYGLSFIPVRSMEGSQLIEVLCLREVTDPYSREKHVAIPALKPDFAIVHVQEADVYGNSKIHGPKYEDLLMVRAAGKVIVTAEKIISTDLFLQKPDYADIPGNLVTAVAELPGGALPGSCAGSYEIDRELMELFQRADSPAALKDYLEFLKNKMKGKGR